MIVDESGHGFLNVRETARRLGVHENTVRNWARKGVLQSAKVPGTSSLRFDQRDVERLLKGRGDLVSSVEEERRTVGPELVDANQLNQWASTKDAQHKFPELMRRLLAATPGVTGIAVRAGEGVAAPGWDGRADAEGSSFLPNGSLCFEFGVSSGPKQKADDDYRKRKKDPAGVEPRQSIFVFATPRRWGRAAHWAARKKREGFFADVRVLDADDLEGWLQQTPAVHHWISEQLGRRPQDAETLGQWWNRFQMRTNPPVPSSLFLAGRKNQSEQLSEFLSDHPQVVAVQAAWRDDALAFVWATIEKLTAEGKAPQPPLVVSSADTWIRLVAQPGGMTLLPLFDGADLAMARQAGHHVVVPVGWEQVVRGEHIQLPRVDRHEATEALGDADLPESEDAYHLSALARRSMPAFVRSLARTPASARPDWARPPDGPMLAPLVLIGSWTASDSDTAVVSEVAGRPWPEVESLLLRWRSADDPPFVRPGTQWHLASAREAFALLGELLSASDLQRWEGIAVDVLLERDPKLDLTPDERPMAGLTGAVRKHSSVLRSGLAQGIALLSTIEDAHLSDGVAGSVHAQRLVRQILNAANDDGSGQTWASLSDELRLLAEASPEEFLDAVNADLDRQEPVLRQIFQDNDGGSALFSSSPHTGLLWALETLCWSPDHLWEASRALARLAAIDPGGRLSNRPLNSLSEVFVGWIRHTSASLDIRVKALEQISRNTPDIAWKLLLAIWPSHHGTSSPPSSPRFRDWKPESRRVAVAEWGEFVKDVVRLAIGLAGSDAKRWAELGQRLGPLPPELREEILEGLSRLAETDGMPPEDQLTLWEQIDREVARHRRHPTAEWAMSEDLLERMAAIATRLEPKAEVARHAYLFDWRPDLPGLKKGEDDYQEILTELRRNALEESLATGNLEGIQALAKRSKAVGHLGWALGEVAPEELTGQLLSWLGSEDLSARAVAESWASRRVQDGGIDWLRTALARPDMTDPGLRKALALCAPATSDVWDVLAEIDEALFHAYWTDANVWRVAPPDMERAVDELLKHGRPWHAVDLLTAILHGQAEESANRVEPELVAKVLDSALGSDVNETPSQSPGYEIGELLDYLEAQGHSITQLVRYEFAFFPLLEDYRQPRALYAALADQPELFVDLVKRVYRGKNEPRRQLTEQDSAMAQHAWRVLEDWRRIPGVNEEGIIDVDHLGRWVKEVRLALTEADRADIGDEQVGAVLSASPEGADGIWPAEPVRELIESIGSTSIETGFHTGVVNSRGITSRGAYDGGDQERALAERYRGWAKACAGRWPRTSRVLRLLAESYEQDARWHDDNAEVSGDVE